MQIKLALLSGEGEIPGLRYRVLVHAGGAGAVGIADLFRRRAETSAPK